MLIKRLLKLKNQTMHEHELNPWKTIIALSVFVVIVLIGFITLSKPLMTYKLDMNQSLEDLKQEDAYFYPWQLDGFLNDENANVVLFDIRDNYVLHRDIFRELKIFSAKDLTQEKSIKRLEDL